MTTMSEAPAEAPTAPKKTVRAPKPTPPVHVPESDLPPSVFEKLKAKVWKHRYAVQLNIGHLVGGTPTDPKVAEGWIRTKMGTTSAEQVAAAVKEVMDARPGITADDAAAQVARNRNLSGFKRDFTTPIALQVQNTAATVGVKVLTPDDTYEHRVFSPEDAAVTFGELYVEGRQIKAMLKEAVNIAMAAGRVEPRGWGKTNKGIMAFLVEHMFVPEEKVFLGVTDPTRINRSFVHTFRGSGIKLEEVLDDAVLDFTLLCDVDFAEKAADFWGHVFLTGEMNGLGASRSQGFGTFSTTRFEPIR